MQSSKIGKAIFAFLVVIIIIGAAIKVLLPVRSQPHAESVSPISQSSAQIEATAPSQSKQCTIDSANFHYAYKLEISTSASAAMAEVYQSTLTLNAQLQQSAPGQMLIKTQNATVHENNIDKPVADALFSATFNGAPYVQITSFDFLQLPAKHPLQAVAQFAKALSIGVLGQEYQYQYDALKRRYLYNGAGANISRSNLDNTGLDQSWQVELDQNCIVSKVNSIERQKVDFVGATGVMQFKITASRIDNFADLSQVAINSQANSSNFWTSDEINASKFAAPVTSLAEFKKLLSDFDRSKNSARLARGAEFLINNISASETANLMAGDELTSAQKRVLAYSLSLSQDPNTQNYMLDTINYMPVGAGDNTDVQTMRLMVSLSGYKNIDNSAFGAMNALSQNPQQSANIRSNATLAMGTMLPTLAAKGQSAGLREQFINDVKTTLNQAQSGDNSQRSAILAIGNAKLDDPELNQLISTKLNSSNPELRYAATKVLARDSKNYAKIIQQLQSENNSLVINAATSNIDAHQLSSSERQNLQMIANEAGVDSDKAKLINSLLSTPQQ